MATIRALSANWVDVNNAVGTSVDGDTVIIPDTPVGGVTWPNQLTITKFITLKGENGMGNTIIHCTYVSTTSLNKFSIKFVPTNGSPSYRWGLEGLVLYRDVSESLLLLQGTNTTGNGVLGTSGNFRMNDCKLVNSGAGTASDPNQHLFDFRDVTGVVDHCDIDSSAAGRQWGSVFNEHWHGYQHGHGSYMDPVVWDSANFIYFEDCVFRNGASETYEGGRMVVRHCTFLNDAAVGNHGAESHGHGIRAMAFYNNWVRGHATGNPVADMRSGTVIAHDNIVDIPSGSGNGIFNLTCHRLITMKIAGSCRGENPSYVGITHASGPTSDQNQPLANTNLAPSPSNEPIHGNVATDEKYAIPDSTSRAGYVLTLTDLDGAFPDYVTKNTTRGFAFQVVNVEQPDMGAGYIVSNSSTTLTISSITVGKYLAFAAGEHYAIRKVYAAQDMPGMGVIEMTLAQAQVVSGTAQICNQNAQTASADVTNSNNLTTSSRALGWMNQKLDPCYAWNNRNNSFVGNTLPLAAEQGIMVLNVHYFNSVKPAPGYTATLNGRINDTDAPGYPLTLNASATAAQKQVGAKDITGVSNSLVLFGSLTTQNVGGWTYPHPLVGTTPDPSITSANTKSFINGTADNSPGFQVTIANFAGTPAYTKTGTLPTGVAFSGSGVLSYSGVASTNGSYPIVITETGSGATQDFIVVMSAATTKIIALTGSMAFGDLDINTTTTKSLTITNSGNTVLTVTGITLPSGFVADWTSGTIAAGASHVSTITFSPLAATTYSGTITVASDKTSGTNTIAVSGTGTTRVIALSGSLAFGDITVGQTATRQLTITNSGNRALSITTIAYPEGFSGDFSSASIAAGASRILNVTFSPTAAQAYSGTIDITSNKTSGTSTSSVSGTGTASATKIIQLTGSLDFGTIQTGTTPTKVLTITNSGDADLVVSGITYPSGFTGSYSGTIAAGASYDVTVTFSPVSAILYSGTVTVASDATDGINTTTASGTGAVSATRIVALTGDLGFGNVVIGGTATRQFVITNNGNSPLAVSSITLPTGFSGTYSGTLAPGETASVDVTFSPAALQGYSGNVTVLSDAISGTGTIATSGTGVATSTRVIGLTGNLAFGNVQKNHNVQRIFTISNSGTGTLTVSGITYPTGFTGDWSSGTIAPGATQNVTVTFRPIAAQTYGGTITVASDKTTGVNTIVCSGTGTNKKQVPFVLIVG